MSKTYDEYLLETATALVAGVLARESSASADRADIIDEALATAEILLADVGILHPDIMDGP